jgi:hypothetical protein
MNTTQVTQADARPKVVERLETWAGLVTGFAWIQAFFGVGWGAELVVNSAKSEFDYSKLGMALMGISLVTFVVLGMLAAWARAWAAWATDSR